MYIKVLPSLFSLPESVMIWPMKSSKNAQTKMALRPREVASCFPNLGLLWSTHEYDRGGNIENKSHEIRDSQHALL